MQTLCEQGFGAKATVARYPPPNSPELNPFVGCNASGIPQTSPKAKIILDSRMVFGFG